MTYIKALYPTLPRNFNRFIIPKPKPDPLVEVLHKLGWDKDTAADLRAALEARGLTIITKEKD
jgi:phosphoglycolate phosphatase-like HAD superfamily hydrolase